MLISKFFKRQKKLLPLKRKEIRSYNSPEKLHGSSNRLGPNSKILEEEIDEIEQGKKFLTTLKSEETTYRTLLYRRQNSNQYRKQNLKNLKRKIYLKSRKFKVLKQAIKIRRAKKLLKLRRTKEKEFKLREI